MSQLLDHSATSWRGQSLSHQDSVVDLLDPSLRVLAAFAFAFVLVLSQVFLPLLVGLGLALLVAVLAKLDLMRTFKRMLAMDLFMISLIILLPFTTPGTPIWQGFGLSASWQGLEHALMIALKANGVMLMLLALVGTLSPVVLAQSLAKLKVPEKLVHLMLFTLRYLDVINQEYARMRLAMRARAFVMGCNCHTWRSIGYLIGMLLIHSLERSERIFNAMKCRGYQGKLYLHHDVQWQRKDHLFVGLTLLSLTTLIGMNFIWV